LTKSVWGLVPIETDSVFLGGGSFLRVESGALNGQWLTGDSLRVVTEPGAMVVGHLNVAYRVIAGGAAVHTEPNLAWKVIAHGDYNGDRKADILWRNESTGQVYLMLMDGTAIASQALVFTEPNTAWKILGTREYGLATGIAGP